MKLSNILLASIITSTMGVSAQVNDPKKDSISIQKNTNIKSSELPQDSIILVKQNKQKCSIKPYKQHVKKDSIVLGNNIPHLDGYCPACGRG